MGFNTAFLVCNDYLYDIEKDGNVGRAISEIVHDIDTPDKHKRHPYGYKGIKGISTGHADYDQIVSVGRNHGKLIGTGVTVNPIIEAAKLLSQTQDPAERRRLIRRIEQNGLIMHEMEQDRKRWEARIEEKAQESTSNNHPEEESGGPRI